MAKRICVAGIGAIGGLLAAMLGKRYAGDLSLIARGPRAEALRRQGVVLHSEFYGELTAHPARIASRGEEIGPQDIVFVCVKNYSLEQIAESLRPAVDSRTTVIPVMNGTEAGDRLRALFPEAIVGDAVIYTVTGANADYTITQKGPYTRMFIGDALPGDAARTRAIREAYDLLKSVDFDARWTDDIRGEIWQKYILNCAFNTMTARYRNTSGDIRASEQLKADAFALLSETTAVARACGVSLPADLAEQKCAFMMEGQAPGATSSMRRDMDAGRQTEIDAFTGSVLRKAQQYGLQAPVTRAYHEALLAEGADRTV